MDRSWVKDIQTGQRATGVFAVARKQQAMGKNGKPFLKVLLQDKTGQLDARIWNQADELASLFEAGDRVRIEGQVASFQGRPQLTIEAIEKSLDESNPEDFAFEPPPAPAQAAPGEASFGALRGELSRVTDPHVRALLSSFLDDPEIAAKLRRAPAAKEIHHARPGGLLEHLLSCVRLAGRLADHYPMADRDLLLAGAFLHDLGKISELNYDRGTTTYTDEGKLVGHLVMTATWIHEKAKAISGFPKEIENHLVHMVLAHHGRLEYGSPKLPMTIEAYLVHALDEIDSRIDSMLGQMARSPGAKWTDPQKTHERMLWKGPAPTEAGRRRGSPAKGWGKTRGERREKREPQGAAEGTTEAPRRERRMRERGIAEPRLEAAPAAPAEAPALPSVREGGERRGPKILKRAEGGRPAAGGEKLTFKPFSAFTEPSAEQRPEEQEAPPEDREKQETAAEAREQQEPAAEAHDRQETAAEAREPRESRPPEVETKEASPGAEAPADSTAPAEEAPQEKSAAGEPQGY